jgi:hypothetical protein
VRYKKQLVILGLATAVVAACEQPATTAPDIEPAFVQTGNGAPSGAHYNLNIIGVPREKTADMTNNSGHRIFVALTGNTKILLYEGEYAVLDANGTDGQAAFQLPNPDPDGDGTTVYSVFARALGQPGGSSITTTCATDPATLEEVCSVVSLELTRSTGKSIFKNVSRYLLYIYADLDGDGDLERVPLFDDRLEGYFWDYDNNGLRLAQLRFYECSTTVPDDPTDPSDDPTNCFD